MTVIMFDLGDTLESEGKAMPGAQEMLSAVAALRDPQGDVVVPVLISDFTMPANTADIPKLKKQYVDIVIRLGFGGFFQPFDTKVTLSTEAGVMKPAKKLFRLALDRVFPDLAFKRSMFLTENKAHVTAARKLGIHALQLKTAGHSSGDVPDLPSFVPLARAWLASLI